MQRPIRYRITCGGEVIGTTSLERCDEAMGVLSGAFFPTAAYERVRDVFRLYATAGARGAGEDPATLQAYFAARDALDLRVETENATQLRVSTVHIVDFAHELGEYEVFVWADSLEGIESCGKLA